MRSVDGAALDGTLVAQPIAWGFASAVEPWAVTRLLTDTPAVPAQVNGEQLDIPLTIAADEVAVVRIARPNDNVLWRAY